MLQWTAKCGLPRALQAWSALTPVARGRVRETVLPVALRHQSSMTCGSAMPDFLRVSEEVSEAVASRRPVVALESTIITHGMPHPHNYSTAVGVETCVRDAGAVPATVAVLRGKLCVGVSDEELQFLSEQDTGLWKISRRDLAFVLGQGLSGGTTVSGTMIGAHMAGVPIFATGGIGGVHRGAETSFDVSADLTELGRTPVTVVSAGVKSILDIPKTLEYLETQGVNVATFGKTRSFPAFFTRDSGYLSPHKVVGHMEAARMIDTSLQLGLTSGILIAVPIPKEHAVTGEVIQDAIDEAVELARLEGVSGRDVTPYVLSRVNELTSGHSLKSNIALVQNNAKVAAGIANCLSQLRRARDISRWNQKPVAPPSSVAETPSSAPSGGDRRSSPSSRRGRDENGKIPGRPVVLGATLSDLSVKLVDEDFKLDGGTYAGKVMQSFGGVGRNLADCLSRLQMSPVFVSVVGNDAGAAAFFANCSHMDLHSVLRVSGASTASYCPVLGSSGQLLFGVGDMDINAQFDQDLIKSLQQELARSPPLVILDGNFSARVIGEVVLSCSRHDVPVWFEPTDLQVMSRKPFLSEAWKHLSLVTPNLGELVTMWKSMRQNLGQDDTLDAVVSENWSTSDIIEACVPLCRDLLRHIPCVLLTLGRHGVVLCHRCPHSSETLSFSDLLKAGQSGHFSAVYFPELNKDSDISRVVSVSGAGDCLASTFVAGLLNGQDVTTSMRRGMQAAWLSLHSITSVPDSISVDRLRDCDVSEGRDDEGDDDVVAGRRRDWGPVDVSDGQLG